MLEKLEMLENDLKLYQRNENYYYNRAKNAKSKQEILQFSLQMNSATQAIKNTQMKIIALKSKERMY